MVFIGRAATIALLLAITAPPQQPGADDPAPLARRLAATAELAAQEYRLGVQRGRVVSKEEVDEARLFLTEARRTAGLLPLEVGRVSTEEIDRLLRMVNGNAEPDSLDARVRGLTAMLADRLRVSLDEVPAATPRLARGAEIYQANCANCHGTLGRGDGVTGAGLTPPPADLTDPRVLRDRSPLDFYHRISIGVAGTAMPAFEARLSIEDRWAASVYSSLLRLPAPRGEPPPALRAFATTARMSDAQILAALAPVADSTRTDARAALAAVRSYQSIGDAATDAAPIFARVRQQLDSALALAGAGQFAAASGAAFDSYMTFEQVERSVRARNPTLASDLETGFAAFRTRGAGGATAAELRAIHAKVAAGLENAERVVADQFSPVNLFAESFVILLREGLEAILVIGALMAFLVKTGAAQRRRDINLGVGAAIAASLLTAALLETLFQITPAHQEALEGITMMVATAMLFYVSYWLLSKMEVAKWNRFVKGKVQDALSSGSALALASVAFLAVYREGFETVLFYKALFVAGGSGSTVMPVLAGFLAGSVVLAVVYLAINRFGVRLPLKPFFGLTSAFLYYMAFVFAGKGIAELQEGGLVSTTIVDWAPRVAALGVYPTVESLALQGLLVLLLSVALVWTFLIEPRRLKVTSEMVPEPSDSAGPGVEPSAAVSGDLDLFRSLDRMDADLAELRAEVERLKRKLTVPRTPSSKR